jgi:hypothetical protein
MQESGSPIKFETVKYDRQSEPKKDCTGDVHQQLLTTDQSKGVPHQQTCNCLKIHLKK